MNSSDLETHRQVIAFKIKCQSQRRRMRRRSFLGILSAVTVGTSQTRDVAIPKRPRVPGTLSLRTRRRAEQAPDRSKVRISENVRRWEVAQTAIIICDMWDTHTCSLSAQRVAALAPRMNQVVSAARSLGVMIVPPPVTR